MILFTIFSKDDTLNTSAGPLTDAQLFEQIVKDTKRKNEEDEKKLLAKEEESKIEVKKEDETENVKVVTNFPTLETYHLHH